MPTTKLDPELEKKRSRLEAIAAEYGTQAEFGEKIGWTQSRVSRALNPSQTTERRLEALEGAIAKLHVGYADVTGVEGARGGETTLEVIEREGGEYTLAHVPLVSVRGDCGEGEEPFETEIDSYLTFEERQIRQETGVNPKRLVAFRIVGNSMRPTLHPGDKALIARNNGEPIYGGGIYAFHREMQGIIVKRAHWKKDGALLLRSDNREDAVDFEIGPEDDHEWNVLGRVVKVIKDL